MTKTPSVLTLVVLALGGCSSSLSEDDAGFQTTTSSKPTVAGGSGPTVSAAGGTVGEPTPAANVGRASGGKGR